MPVRIRLSRGGAKKRPFYRIVVADSRRSRDGKFIDQVGTYNPMLKKDNPERIKIDLEKAKEWIAKGAQPSDRVKLFLSTMGVGEKPIIQTIIENFMEYGFNNFVISTYYKSEMVKDFLGDGKNMNCSIEYLEEESPLGTAGCLSLLSETHLKKPVIMMNGDILTKVNFTQLLDFHIKAKTSVTMCARNYTHQIPYGVINTKDHLIESIDEKPTQVSKVNAGIYIVNPETIKNLKSGMNLDMPSLINNELERNNNSVSVFPIHEYWLDIGQMKDYQKAQVDFLSNFSNE